MPAAGRPGRRGLGADRAGGAGVPADRDQPAADWYGQALTVFTELGNRSGQAWSLTGSGTVQMRLGRPAVAIDLHRGALALFEAIGDPDGPPRALAGLDDAYRALADGPAPR